MDHAAPQRLYIDIETAPILGWSYQKYETTLLDTFRDWSILSFAYQWGDGNIEYEAIKKPRDIWDFVCHPDNDKYLVKSLWRLLDRADYVIGHNADRFDVRKIQSRFLYYGLPPPAPFKVIDTKKVAKRVGDNTSNKLDDLGQHWNLGKKLEHQGWDMWKKCLAGDTKTWRIEKAYNIQDVKLLHKIYDRLLPWVKNLEIGMWTERTVCANCGGPNLTLRGYYYTKTQRYQRILCKGCGRWMRATNSEPRTKPLVGL